MYAILSHAVLQFFITSQVHSHLQFKLFHTTAGLLYTVSMEQMAKHWYSSLLMGQLT